MPGIRGSLRLASGALANSVSRMRSGLWVAGPRDPGIEIGVLRDFEPSPHLLDQPRRISRAKTARQDACAPQIEAKSPHRRSFNNLPADQNVKNTRAMANFLRPNRRISARVHIVGPFLKNSGAMDDSRCSGRRVFPVVPDQSRRPRGSLDFAGRSRNIPT